MAKEWTRHSFTQFRCAPPRPGQPWLSCIWHYLIIGKDSLSDKGECDLLGAALSFWDGRKTESISIVTCRLDNNWFYKSSLFNLPFFGWKTDFLICSLSPPTSNLKRFDQFFVSNQRGVKVLYYKNLRINLLWRFRCFSIGTKSITRGRRSSFPVPIFDTPLPAKRVFIVW